MCLIFGENKTVDYSPPLRAGSCVPLMVSPHEMPKPLESWCVGDDETENSKGHLHGYQDLKETWGQGDHQFL